MTNPNTPPSKFDIDMLNAIRGLTKSVDDLHKGLNAGTSNSRGFSTARNKSGNNQYTRARNSSRRDSPTNDGHNSGTQHHTYTKTAQDIAREDQSRKWREKREKTYWKDQDRKYEQNKRQDANANKSYTSLITLIGKLNKQLKQQTQNTKEYNDALQEAYEVTHALQNSPKQRNYTREKQVEAFQSQARSGEYSKDFELKSTNSKGRNAEIVSIMGMLANVIPDINDFHSKVNAAKSHSEISQISKEFADRMHSAGVETAGKDIGDAGSRYAKIKRRMDKYRNIPGANSAKADALEAQYRLQLNAAIHQANIEFKDLAGHVATNAKRTAVMNEALSITEEKLAKLGITGLNLVSIYTQFRKAAEIWYEYTKSMAKVQMGGATGQVAINALGSGVSVDALTKFYQQQGTQVAQVGFNAVKGGFDKVKDTIKMLGLFGDDALALFSDTYTDLKNIGINQRGGAQNEAKFVAESKKYIENLNEMSKMTGATAAEIAAFNREIISSSDSTQMMMRLNVQERSVKMKSILAEKDRITALVASNEEAVKFTKILQNYNNQHATKRIENSAKIAATMQQLGMGADAAKMAQISMKRDEQLTDEERKFKTDTAIEMGKRIKAGLGSNQIGNEIATQHILDSLPESLRQLVEGGAEANYSKEMNGSIDKNSATTKKVMDTKQIGEFHAAALSFFNNWNNALKNPILASLMAIAAGVAMLVMLQKNFNPLSIVGSLLSKGLGGTMRAAGGAIMGGVGSLATAAGGIASGVIGKVGGIGGGLVAGAKSVGAKAGKAGAAAKGLAKGAGKMGWAALPGIGAAIGLGSSLMDGDFTGALMHGGALAATVGSIFAPEFAPLLLKLGAGLEVAAAGRDIYKGVNGDEKSEASPENPTENDDLNTKKTDLVDSITQSTKDNNERLDKIIDLLSQMVAGTGDLKIGDKSILRKALDMPTKRDLYYGS